MIYLFWAIISFLAVLGAVDLVRKSVFWLYKPIKTTIYMGAVIKNIDDAENTLRTMVERLKWMELGTSVKMVIIDKTQNSEMNEITQKIIKKFPNISLL